MGRPVGLVEIVGQLPQHGGIAIDRTHGRALRIGQRRQPVIGAKDIGGPVDEVEMLLFGHCLSVSSESASMGAPSHAKNRLLETAEIWGIQAVMWQIGPKPLALPHSRHYLDTVRPELPDLARGGDCSLCRTFELAV